MNAPFKTPQFADCFIQLSPGQLSALAAYDNARCGDDDELLRGISYHLEAWDKHYGRESTLTQRLKRNDALRIWGSYIYENGGGI